MAEYNVIYLDDDERNARPLMSDNRRPGTSVFGRRPMGGIVVPPSNRPTVIQTGGAASRPYYPAGYQPTVVYHQPAGQAPMFGNLNMADLADLGLQVLAALRPLPPAPTGQGAVETVVNNMVIYQTALAEFAQNDERLRTLGNVLSRFLRK